MIYSSIMIAPPSCEGGEAGLEPRAPASSSSHYHHTRPAFCVLGAWADCNQQFKVLGKNSINARLIEVIPVFGPDGGLPVLLHRQMSGVS